ncbi:MAG: RNA polymerase sigma factor [Bacilli bacterium]|nr:RNA polymerase sigma factor [Bacilli bacterium]
MRKISNEAFNELYYQYKPMIYNIAYTYVHNVHDADDIVQEVFLKYLKSTEEFAGKNNEKYWLIRVTINTAKSFVTSSWRKKVILDEETIDKQKNNDSDSNDDLFEIIYSLPRKYKEVIVLYYYEDLMIAEIASILSISQSACKKRLERARNLIRAREVKNG